jgi:hypothetical protein
MRDDLERLQNIKAAIEEIEKYALVRPAEPSPNLFENNIPKYPGKI